MSKISLVRSLNRALRPVLFILLTGLPFMAHAADEAPSLFSDDSNCAYSDLYKLNLSSPLLKILKRKSICTIEELIAKTEDELSRYQSMGKMRLEELNVALRFRGLSLANADRSKDLPESIWSLDISVRTRNALKWSGIETIDQIIEQAKNNELSRVQGLGPVGIKDIEEALAKIGRSLEYESQSELGKIGISTFAVNALKSKMNIETLDVLSKFSIAQIAFFAGKKTALEVESALRRMGIEVMADGLQMAFQREIEKNYRGDSPALLDVHYSKIPKGLLVELEGKEVRTVADLRRFVEANQGSDTIFSPSWMVHYKELEARVIKYAKLSCQLWLL